MSCDGMATINTKDDTKLTNVRHDHDLGNGFPLSPLGPGVLIESDVFVAFDQFLEHPLIEQKHPLVGAHPVTK